LEEAIMPALAKKTKRNRRNFSDAAAINAMGQLTLNLVPEKADTTNVIWQKRYRTTLPFSRAINPSDLPEALGSVSFKYPGITAVFIIKPGSMRIKKLRATTETIA
jgi:hypothetical protein